MISQRGTDIQALDIQTLLPGMDLCLIPAGRSPNSAPPNLIDPPSLQSTVIALATILLSLSFVILAGRIFVNRKTLSISDWTMMVALIFDAAVMGVFIAISHTFRHIWDVPICYVLGSYLKLAFVTGIIASPALFFPKAAIFLFYIQIFDSTKTVKIGSIVGIIAAFLAYFPESIAAAYYNIPHNGQDWDDLAITRVGEKGLPASVALGVCSVVLDLYIFILPLPTLIRLNLARHKRIQLISLFATAFLAIVASAVCLVYRVKLLHLTDNTWQSGILTIPVIIENNVAIIENNVAIIVGSLPAFAAFLRKYLVETSAYKSLRSLLLPSKPSSAASKWDLKQGVETFGGGGKARKKVSYFELSEVATLKTQTTGSHESSWAPGHNPHGSILRTIDVFQEERKASMPGQNPNHSVV